MDNFIESNSFNKKILKQVEINIKYKGYIERETSSAKRLKNLDNIYLRKNLDYFKIGGLTFEAQEKLSRIKPETLGQASRIAGISPSDISILMVYLKK
jgi:tRNA uridine 5-carboxymethylaminomethyl modification enzyme